MTTFDFTKLVAVGAVKADEGRGAQEAAAMTYEELLAVFRRQRRR
jgi:hypothetical protein